MFVTSNDISDAQLSIINNYRPVSVLLVISKVFEKLKFDQLYSVFTPVFSDTSCGHTTDFYLGKPFLPRANSSKIYLGKFISGFVLPR